MIIKACLGVLAACLFNRLYRELLQAQGYKNAKILVIPNSIFCFAIPLKIIFIYRSESIAALNFSLLKELLFLITLSYIALIDLNQTRIPNRILVHQLLLISGIVFLEIVSGRINLLSYFPALLITLLLTGGSFLIVYLITRGALGAGDVKLMFILGLSLQRQIALTAMVYALILSTLGALILVLLKRKKPKDAIPFAPFIYLGTLFTLLFR